MHVYHLRPGVPRTGRDRDHLYHQTHPRSMGDNHDLLVFTLIPAPALPEGTPLPMERLLQ